MVARSGVGAQFIDKSRRRDPMRGARIAQAPYAHVIAHHHPVAPPRAIYGIKFPEFLARAASLRRRPGYSSSVRRLSSGRESGLGEDERRMSGIIDASAGAITACLVGGEQSAPQRSPRRPLSVPTAYTTVTRRGARRRHRWRRGEVVIGPCCVVHPADVGAS